MTRKKVTGRKLSPYLEVESKTIMLSYLHQQKDLFTGIMDELALLRVNCVSSLNIPFREDLGVIEGRFHDMQFVKLPYVFSNKYWCILRYIGECIRLTQVLFIECEVLNSTQKLASLDKIQVSLENALGYIIHLIEMTEAPKELHHFPID